MPMNKPTMRTRRHVSSGGRFMNQDVQRRIEDPTAILLSDSLLRILHHKPRVGQVARVVFVTAPDGFPIGWLELKPIRPAGSEMLTFVGRTTEDLGLFQIGIERTDFG